MYLEYVRVHVIHRVHQAEHVIHMLVVAPQEYVNIYSTRRVAHRRGLGLRVKVNPNPSTLTPLTLTLNLEPLTLNP